MPFAALSADETVFVAVELRDEANDCYYYNALLPEVHMSE